jgi:exopolyphosphatase/pppGpp-phosphohydrolase
VAALGGQFGSWNARQAERRGVLVERLLAVLRPQLPGEATSAAAFAARLLDVGASIDYYRRHAHTARIIADANIDGYSHRTLALGAAAVQALGEREATSRGYGPVLGGPDVPVIEQIAAAVGLADALVRYGSADVDQTCPERSNGHVALATPVLDAWPLEAPTRRAERAFGVSFALGDRARAT